MTKTVKNPRPFAVMMTDEEVEEFHERQKKEKLLNELLTASNKSFSVKNIKTKDDKKKELPALKASGSLKGPEDPAESNLGITDEDWDAILEKASVLTPSPIDDITQSELGTFRLEDSIVEDTSSYNSLFKKEQSMLAELMKDVTEQARAANNKLKDMAKKSSGYGGVSKTYPDLLSAANSLNTTRLNIVKQMADLKKTVADLNMKKAKEEGPDTINKDNEVADVFFNKILANRKNFIDASMDNALGGSDMSYTPRLPSRTSALLESGFSEEGLPLVGGEYGVSEEEPEAPRRSRRSITSPLMDYRDDDEDTYTSGDPYGYIKHEDKDVSICVQRYQDGRVEFVAVDEDGEGVDGYELPGEDLLLSLEFRIGSNFATDEEGRRYRIIDVDPSGIDISDILDDDE